MVAFLANFRRVLEDLVARPDAAISDLEVLAPSERERLVSEWNRTEVPFDRSLCLHHLFEAQVEKTPDAVAVVSEEGSLTYRELESRANALAERLASEGIGAEARVGICLPRTADLVVALLGVMKSGAAYVPLDPAYPEERLALMLGDSGAKAVVSDSPRRLPETTARVLRLDEVLEEGSRGRNAPPRPAVGPGNLVYVLYTSGSTGTPKGVAIAHRSAVALIEWAKGSFTDEELSGVAFTTSICFDLSVFELFLPLSRGGRVIVLEDALAIAGSPHAREARLINTVPSAIGELVRSKAVPSSVRTICLAGETLSPSLVREICAGTSATRVLDLYGPSEDTTYSTHAHRLPDGPATIGRPIANTQIYILDEGLSPVPRGAAGELVIGGDGLARGYLQRPAETAAKFVPDPFSGRAGSRLYRTGDLARHLPDGRLEFLGRRDHQVKLRGFRIELSEIEEALRRHEAIEAAAVLSSGQGPDAQLTAYIACGTGAQPTVTELRRYIRSKLPPHMVPSTFVVLDALPLTPNGKIDRRALSRSEATPTRGERYVAPRTDLERAIALVWAGLLAVERVGIHDNFFDLGGHSLMSIRAIAGIEKETGVRLGVRDLMFQTLEQCASVCEEARRA
ncbi:MAG: non-ribosomal peptide synthetase, partial [Vicinamibacteria bacterium]